MGSRNITEKDVTDAQEKWANGVINIGKQFLEKNDYVSYAELFLDELYAFNFEDVLFKPTLASEKQFRLDKTSALSYFVGKNTNYNEDKGFALNCWTNIRFENIGVKIYGDIAITMGNYFMIKDDQELKVEYSFVYKKDNQGNLRIILHDSHLPYTPASL